MNESSAIPRVKPADLDTATMPTLDVRGKPGHHQIRGALRYDVKPLLAADKLTLPFAHDSRIVVYANDEQHAAEIAARLRQQGYKNAAILDGGFEAYREAGLPVEEVTQEQPVPGQEGAGLKRF